LAPDTPGWSASKLPLFGMLLVLPIVPGCCWSEGKLAAPVEPLVVSDEVGVPMAEGVVAAVEPLWAWAAAEIMSAELRNNREVIDLVFMVEFSFRRGLILLDGAKGVLKSRQNVIKTNALRLFARIEPRAKRRAGTCRPTCSYSTQSL
jgi:hypothetical protein